MRMIPAGKSASGFSLVELAIVLFILTLLLGGLLVPLAAQLEARQRGDALNQLDRIKEALIGFALVNGRLPRAFCGDSYPDPADANYGVEDPSASTICANNQATDGILPWKTLGLSSGLDPWGIERTSSTDPWTGYWRYRVDKYFSQTITSLSTSPFETFTVVDAQGNALTSTSESPVAIIYSTGANRTADGLNQNSNDPNPPVDLNYEGGPANNNAGFDDITVWLSRPVLFNRLVTAGLLPQ